METIESITDLAIRAGEFESTASVHPTLLLQNKDKYYGTPSIKKCEVSRFIDTCGEYRGAECVYTVAIRCMGKECKYTDENELDLRISKIVKFLLRDSGCVVRSITRGELERCAATGRLERVLCFTIAGYQSYSWY